MAQDRRRLIISLERIAETEALLGVTFPTGFKAAMARRNGGDVKIGGESWWLFPFRDTSDRRLLKKTFEDIVRNTESARACGLDFPEDGVAIASDRCTSDLLLLRGRPLGREVWYWSPDLGVLELAFDDVMELFDG